MSERAFDRETLLDIAVNLIPLGMILFFVVLFAVTTDFGSGIVAPLVSQGLLVVPFVCLAIVTYVAGRVLGETERDGGSATATRIRTFVTGVDADDADN